MIFAEVASRVGLLGKVNLLRELSERARSTWSERGERKEPERDKRERERERERAKERNDALAMRKRGRGRERDSTTSTGRKSPTKLRRCISPFA